MKTRVHELHPAVVHAPLALLPTAAVVDLIAALRRDGAYDSMGRTLWWGAAASGLFAGLAGMAASQQVRARDPRVDDMMWVHGIINLTLVTGAVAIAGWRTRNLPRVAVAAAGLGASLASMYTAWLGGHLVYSHGVGVKSMPEDAAAGVRHSPPLLSWEGVQALVGDGVRGLGWLLKRGLGALTGREPVDPASLGNVPEPRETLH